MRKFIHRALNWIIRASTRAGRKIPPNADSILRSANLRVAYVIKHEDIPSALIANDSSFTRARIKCHRHQAACKIIWQLEHRRKDPARPLSCGEKGTQAENAVNPSVPIEVNS